MAVINVYERLTDILQDTFKGLCVEVVRRFDKTSIYITMEVDIDDFDLMTSKGEVNFTQHIIKKIVEKKDSLPLIKNEELRIRGILTKLVKKHLKLKEENEGLKRYYDFYQLRRKKA